MTSGAYGIRGYLIDAPEPGQLRSWSNGAIVVENGRIAEIGDYEFLKQKARPEPFRWLHSPRLAVFPGLIDVHTHLPQYPAVAKGQSELLPWLRQYIFPLEREFTGPRARVEAAQFLHELARNGTTTAMVYSSIYPDACDLAFEAAQEIGSRLILGKMMMDVGSYSQLQPKKILSISLGESESLCRKWHGANDGLLEYAFSPRFAVSCSEKMMRGAAELAHEHGAYLQTHLAENSEEIAKVQNLFTWAKDYTDIYDQCGLLTERTVLGHCIHLSQRERNVLCERSASIAHCPTANFFLNSGIMPLDQMRGCGLRVGLGSDVAAGPELSIWRVMRAVIEGQKARSFFQPDVQIPSPADALHLATLSGARALGKEQQIGSFETGKEADLIVMDFGSLFPYGRQSRAAGDLTPEDIVSICVYRGGPAATVETFVRGNSIYRAPARESIE